MTEDRRIPQNLNADAELSALRHCVFTYGLFLKNFKKELFYVLFNLPLATETLIVLLLACLHLLGFWLTIAQLAKLHSPNHIWFPLMPVCCLPGQTAMLQNLVCFSGPSQGSPPNCGGVQVRVRDLKPLPQVDEHKLHGDHSSQAPCTVIRAAPVVGFVTQATHNIPQTTSSCVESTVAQLHQKSINWNHYHLIVLLPSSWVSLLFSKAGEPDTQYSRDFQQCRQRCFWKGRNHGLSNCQVPKTISFGWRWSFGQSWLGQSRVQK